MAANPIPGTGCYGAIRLLIACVALKENILMGRLIPAGTGFAAYQKLGMMIHDRAMNFGEGEEAV